MPGPCQRRAARLQRISLRSDAAASQPQNRCVSDFRSPTICVAAARMRQLFPAARSSSPVSRQFHAARPPIQISGQPELLEFFDDSKHGYLRITVTVDLSRPAGGPTARRPPQSRVSRLPHARANLCRPYVHQNAGQPAGASQATVPISAGTEHSSRSNVSEVRISLCGVPPGMKIESPAPSRTTPRSANSSSSHPFST